MSTSQDPAAAFALFELQPTLELDTDALERVYLQRTRECHPDHHAAADPERLSEMLDLSARLNDAYRKLGDRWERAALALEAREPGVLQATKSLDPAFLMEAMEWAEEADSADDPATRSRFEDRVEGFWSALHEAFETDRLREAATLFHQSKYARKALADLGGADSD